MGSSTGSDWSTVREKVLERDDRACRFCGTTNREHREEHGRGLHAHHVIPDAGGGSDSMQNLITVCGSCHRTLEETHASAVAENLEGVDHVWRENRKLADELDDRLADFVESHPVFTREFGVYITQNRVVEAPDFKAATATVGDAEIQSEWGFAVAWGYKRGIVDVILALDERTDVPFSGP